MVVLRCPVYLVYLQGLVQKHNLSWTSSEMCRVFGLGVEAPAETMDRRMPRGVTF